MNTKFKTWKKVKIGTGLKTFADFYDALRKRRVTVHDLEKIEVMINNPMFTVFDTETEVDLVQVEFFDKDELGIKGCGKGSDIKINIHDLILRANNMGLEECPPEAGLQLRLQHSYDFPSHGGVEVVMNPINGNIFKVYTGRNAPDYSGWSRDERPILTDEEEEQLTTYCDAICVSDSINPCYWLSRYVFMKPIK